MTKARRSHALMNSAGSRAFVASDSVRAAHPQAEERSTGGGLRDPSEAEWARAWHEAGDVPEVAGRPTRRRTQG